MFQTVLDTTGPPVKINFAFLQFSIARGNMHWGLLAIEFFELRMSNTRTLRTIQFAA